MYHVQLHATDNLEWKAASTAKIFSFLNYSSLRLAENYLKLKTTVSVKLFSSIFSNLLEMSSKSIIYLIEKVNKNIIYNDVTHHVNTVPKYPKI